MYLSCTTKTWPTWIHRDGRRKRWSLVDEITWKSQLQFSLRILCVPKGGEESLGGSLRWAGLQNHASECWRRIETMIIDVVFNESSCLQR